MKKKLRNLKPLANFFLFAMLLNCAVNLSAQTNINVSGSLLVNAQSQRFVMKGTNVYVMPFFWKNTLSNGSITYGYRVAGATNVWAGTNELYNSAFNNRSAQMDAMKAAGINTIRVFCGQVVANDPDNQLGGYDAYIQRMADYAETARQKGMYVVYNYINGEWYENKIAEPFTYSPTAGPYPYNLYEKFVQKCKAHPSLGSNQYVIYEVQNEPTNIDYNAWNTFTKRSIQTFRTNGYTGPLICQTNYIANSFDDGQIASVMATDNNLVIALHWYAFVDWNNTNGWLNKCDNGIPTILGEYGISAGGNTSLLTTRGDDLYNKVMTKNFIGAISFAWNTDNDEGNQQTNPFLDGVVLNSWGNVFKNSYASRLPDFFGINVPVSSVSLSPSPASVAAGSTTNLTATVSPSNATNKNVTWSSSNPAAATVSSTGVVTGIAVGTSTITVTTADGNKTATCLVTVTVAGSSSVINIGNTSDGITKVGGWDNTRTGNVNNDERMMNNSSAYCQYTFTGIGVDVLGFKAGGSQYGANYTIYVDGASVATGNTTSSTDQFQVVLGSKSGLTNGSHTVKIEFTSAIGASAFVIADAFRIYTAPANIVVTSVSLSPTTVSLTAGSTTTLAATVSPSNATNKMVSWSSSNPAAATVNSAGLVTGVAVGTATITVTTVDGNKTATCSVNVTAASLSSVINIGNASDGITKVGGWDNTRTGNINNDERMMNTSSAYCQYTFTGIGVDVLGFKAGGSQYGANYTIYVDGISVATGNTTSSTDQFQVVLGSKSGLINGSHTVKIAFTSAIGSSPYVIADAFKIYTGTGARMANHSIVKVPVLVTKPQLIVYPNPVSNGSVSVQINGQRMPAKVNIYNEAGQQVYSGNVEKGRTVRFNKNVLKPGLYLVKVFSKELNEVRKIVVE